MWRHKAQGSSSNGAKTNTSAISISDSAHRPILQFGGRTVDDLPNVKAYVKRIEARPAYQKAMKIAGPAATAPAA